MQIREVMTVPAATVTAEASIGAALCAMREEQMTAIPVVDCQGDLIGIVTETQTVQNRTCDTPAQVGKDSVESTVGEIMSRRIVAVRPGDDVEVAIDLMRSAIVEHLPVLENHHVIGTVGCSDLVGLLADHEACPEHGPGEVSAGTLFEASR